MPSPAADDQPLGVDGFAELRPQAVSLGDVQGELDSLQGDVAGTPEEVEAARHLSGDDRQVGFGRGVVGLALGHEGRKRRLHPGQRRV
jgi:hypothetical protein